MLISKLGQGGMGAVYKARQESMDRTVAIKVLPRNLAKNQEFIERFLREARAAGRLGHPNIVAGIDAGFADGYYYFAMEYVEARNLGDRLDEGSLDEDEVIRIGKQMAEALDHAHAANIVHRDVKPENILVTLGGQAKLCDLGLARSTGEDMRITQAGMTVGTPYYVSPEQVQGKEPDIRADIYSLGATLYHLVTGQPPFDGETPMAVMLKHLNETPPSPRDVRPTGVSPALEAIILKMMARHQENRYQTMDQVASDLHKAASGAIPSALTGTMAARRRGSRRRSGTTSGTRATRPISTRSAQPVEDEGRRLPVKLIAIAAALVALVGMVIAAVVLKSDKPDGNGDNGVIVRPDPEKERLQKLAGELKLIRGYEQKNPGEYGRLIERYTGFLGKAAGTRYEAEVRDALAAVQKRRDQDKSKERLQKLAADLEAISTFEKGNAGKYAEVISRYTTFATGAAGTEFEGKAQAAIAATTTRRKHRARELLSETTRAVAASRKAGRFGEALARLAAFPGKYGGDVKTELGELEKAVRAAGRRKWGDILAEARKLSKAGKFDDAKRKAIEGKTLGLVQIDKEIAAALAQVEKDRRAHQDVATAGFRKKYADFAREFGKLMAAGKFDEAVKKGQALRGKLTPDLETRLAEDLALASGAVGFIKKLRGRLAKARRGAFTARLPIGQRGRFQSYDPRTDGINFKFGPGSTTLKTTDFKGEMLLGLAGKAAGGKLSAAESRGAACYLLSRGEAKGVAALLKEAKAGGQKVADLEKRLAVIAKGAKEVEAERLLARFDDLVKRENWAGVASAGSQLLKEYGGTRAVKARADLAKLVATAMEKSSPLQTYTLTFQEGQPIKVAGVASYSGTENSYLYNYASHVDAEHSSAKETLCAKAFVPVIRFALTRREGGPLPDDARILSAKLLICKTKAYVPYLELRRLTTPWKEKQVTWNSAATGRKWKMPGGDVKAKPCAALDLPALYAKAGSRMSEPAKKIWHGPYWCEFDVTESLAAALTEGKNYGWRMNAFKNKAHDEFSMNIVKFAGSRYDEDKSLRPKLILKVRCRRLKGDTGSETKGANSFRAVWQKLKTNAGPEARGSLQRSCTKMFFDSKRKRCALLGGWVFRFQAVNDVWSLDVAAGKWTRLAKHTPDADGKSHPRPGSLSTKPCAYDPVNDLYLNANGWAFDPDTNKWKMLFKNLLLREKRRFALAWCPPRGKFLAGSGKLGGAAWLDVKTGAVAQVTRDSKVKVATFLDGGMVWVPTLKRFIGFGGYHWTEKLSCDDTWSFDPATGKWQNLKPKHRPPARDAHKLVWHAGAGAVVLFGGETGVKKPLTDLWVFDPTKGDWLEIKARPAPSAPGSTCYDAANDVFVLFTEKTAETWALRLVRGKR